MSNCINIELSHVVLTPAVFRVWDYKQLIEKHLPHLEKSPELDEWLSFLECELNDGIEARCDELVDKGKID